MLREMANPKSDAGAAQHRDKKRGLSENGRSQQPRKKPKVLLDADPSDQKEHSTNRPDGVAPMNGENDTDNNQFTINKDFARRFEHNKRREELHRLEEKYGHRSKGRRPENGSHSDNEDSENSQSSTESEEEDDEGILASEPLDAQIHSTLEAIRKKDPRVYDKNAKFYADPDEEMQDGPTARTKQEKPMYLSDYHRKNLLEGGTTDNPNTNEKQPYAQEQGDLKQIIVQEMHALAESAGRSQDSHNEEEAGDEFLIRKPSTPLKDSVPRQAEQKSHELDIETADQDPEKYLSNFMSARAWVPSGESRFQPFESDDEDEERRAELFEEAYNLRFEDPKSSNEKLLSHARDAVAKYSVRKEVMNPRKRAREAERIKKETANQTREKEKARHRKLKVAEAEEKIRKIKEAAGIEGESLPEEDWMTFLEEGWDDAGWEKAMKKRFGDDYYANAVVNGNSGEKTKFKKPKWEDDIDIDDIIPGFELRGNKQPPFELSDEETVENHLSTATGVHGQSEVVESETQDAVKRKSNSKRKLDDQRKTARQERRKIEGVVDQQLEVDETLSRFGKKHSGQFRYRETSPTAFGLTAQEILMASDSQLNQFAGLKKMAAFRDSDKKRRDKKHLGKKARLRQWRKDTFGNEQGPQQIFADAPRSQERITMNSVPKATSDKNIRQEKRKERLEGSKASGGS